MSRAEFIGFTNDDRFMDGMKAMGFALTRKNFPIHTESHIVLWELVKREQARARGLRSPGAALRAESCREEATQAPSR